MDAVHFLNIEYLLLRVYDVVQSSFVTQATYNAAVAQPTEVAGGSAVFLGSLALFGMFATLIFFALLVWVRIRLAIVESVAVPLKEAELVSHLIQW
jgi:hypothetical protein